VGEAIERVEGVKESYHEDAEKLVVEDYLSGYDPGLFSICCY